MAEQRFTFSFSPQIPRRHVRCGLCGWQATSDDKSVFDQAESHVCPTNVRDPYLASLDRAAERRKGPHG